MKSSPYTTPDVNISAEPENFTPSQQQINTLARRLMPEIKKFFSDEQIQKEFADWMEKRQSDK